MCSENVGSTLYVDCSGHLVHPDRSNQCVWLITYAGQNKATEGPFLGSVEYYHIKAFDMRDDLDDEYGF